MSYDEDLEHENEELRGKASYFADRAEQLATDLSELETERDELSNEKEELEVKYDDLDNEKSTLQDDYDELKEKYDKLEETHEKIESQVEKITGESLWKRDLETQIDTHMSSQTERDVLYYEILIEEVQCLMEHAECEECKKTMYQILKERMSSYEEELSSLKKKLKESGES